EKTLREHHVGPSNRIRQEAKVSFIEVEPEMTGRQVREAVWMSRPSWRAAAGTRHRPEIRRRCSTSLRARRMSAKGSRSRRPSPTKNELNSGRARRGNHDVRDTAQLDYKMIWVQCRSKHSASIRGHLCCSPAFSEANPGACIATLVRDGRL